MEIANVCILGGTGFVGGALCEHLVERGLRVRVLTRSPTAGRHLLVLPTLEVAVADPHDEAVLAREFAGMDAVVNLVGILHETRRQSFEAVHAELPRKIVSACRAAGVMHLVHMSALSASEAGPSQYQRTKALGEKHVREGSLPYTIVRPSVIFGERDMLLNTFAMMATLFPVIPLACADARFQPIWVEDVARAMAGFVGNPAAFGNAYELCGPRVYTLRELVEYSASVSGHRTTVLALPPAVARLQAFTFEHLPGKLLTRDNLLSMSVDNTCDAPFPPVCGFQPSALETVAPTFLASLGARGRYPSYRSRKATQ